MNPKRTAKLITDVVMTIGLLLLMTYELIGQAAHEWIGVGMFILVILHHVLNSRWSGHLRKGKYTAMRTLQTVLVLLLLLSMLASMISGIILSRHVFSFIPIKGGRSFARPLHMISAYWGFVLMSLHLGLHWGMMLGMAGKFFKKPSLLRTWFLRVVGMGIAGYGIYAFIHREIGSYMLLKNQFVFFDFDEPLVFFILDYVAVMGLFVFLGHYLMEGIKCQSRKGKASKDIRKDR